MEHMLVGIDDSETSRRALAWAADVARRSHVGLVVAQVLDPGDEDRDRSLARLQSWAAAESTAGTHHIELSVLDGPVVEALLRDAAERNAGLVVVGGRGTGNIVHQIGSTAHAFVHRTDLPVAVVPIGGDEPVTRLVVGVDGSVGSLAAVDFCADVASALGVPVTAVHAAEPFVEMVPGNDPASWRTTARSEMAQWTAPISDAGVDIELVVDRDIHPVAAIVRALDEHPGAAAVIGTRGLGGFTGLRLGRVPLQLLHHTDHAVIVVPPSE